MAKKHYIYSTLSAPVAYALYTKGPNDVPQEEGRIVIYGGANVANPKSLVTPYGVATEVTAEQLEQLKLDPVFQMHVKNGFITDSTQKEDPDYVAGDLTGRDQSSPLVDNDFDSSQEHAGKGAGPVVNGAQANQDQQAAALLTSQNAGRGPLTNQNPHANAAAAKSNAGPADKTGSQAGKATTAAGQAAKPTGSPIKSSRS